MATSLRDRLRGVAARLRGQTPEQPEQAALPGIEPEAEETQGTGFGSLLRRVFRRRRPEAPIEPDGDEEERDYIQGGPEGQWPAEFEVDGVTFEHEGNGWYFAWNRDVAIPTNFRFSFRTPKEAVSYVGPSKDLGPGYICIRGRDTKWSVYYSDPVTRAMR